MKIVIAIDSFKGSMSSLQAGESAGRGVSRVFGDADIIIRPLADGVRGNGGCPYSGMWRQAAGKQGDGTFRQKGVLPVWNC